MKIEQIKGQFDSFATPQRLLSPRVILHFLRIFSLSGFMIQNFIVNLQPMLANIFPKILEFAIETLVMLIGNVHF